MYVVLLARVLSIYCINQRKITWECVGFHWAGRSYTAVPLAHCRDQNVAWTPRGWISILRPLRPSGQQAGSLFLGVARSLAAAAAETGTSVPGGLAVRQWRRYCIWSYCCILKVLNNLKKNIYLNISIYDITLCDVKKSLKNMPMIYSSLFHIYYMLYSNIIAICRTSKYEY